MKRISVFISHRWRHEKDYEDIRNLLKRKNIPILDFSVPEEKKLFDKMGRDLLDLILEDKIKSRIGRCNIFIVSARPTLKDSKWMMSEILLATTKKKYILAIRPKGEKKSVDPEFLREIAKKKDGKIINYRSSTIINTIYKVTEFDRDFVIPKRKKKKKRKKLKQGKNIFSLSNMIGKLFTDIDIWVQKKF